MLAILTPRNALFIRHVECFLLGTVLSLRKLGRLFRALKGAYKLFSANHFAQPMALP